jgi:hypothetical protein
LEAILGWIATGIGAAGIAAGAIVARWRKIDEPGKRGGWNVALFATIVVAALFLLTRPTEPPFSIGQRLGYGLLLGGLLGIAAGMLTVRLARSADWRTGVALAGFPSMALFGVGVVLLLFGDYPQPVLGGFAVGALTAAIIFRLSTSAAHGVEVWALLAAGLSAGAMISVFRFGATADRFWWRAPLMVMGAAVIGCIAGAAASREDKDWALPGAVASIIVLGLTAVFAWRVFPDWSLLWVAAAGVITFALVAWLTAHQPVTTWAAAFVVLAVLAFTSAAFGLLGGFGIAIGVIASLAVVLPAFASIWREEETTAEELKPAHVLIYAAFISLGVLYLRLFLENYAAEVRGVDLRAHYTLIALILGSLFPFLLSSLLPHPVAGGAGLRIMGAAAVGLFAAVTPLLVLVLWGFRATVGFLMGTIAAEAFVMFTILGLAKIREQISTQTLLLILAAQVAAVQFSGVLAPVAQAPRLTRLTVLAAVVAVGIIWALVSSLLAHRRVREA